MKRSTIPTTRQQRAPPCADNRGKCDRENILIPNKETFSMTTRTAKKPLSAFPQLSSTRIAQVGLDAKEDDLYSWGQETADLLTYLEAVLEVMREAEFADDPALDTLLDLTADLTKEAQRRLGKFRQAAEIWEKRTAGNTSPATQQAPAGEAV